MHRIGREHTVHLYLFISLWFVQGVLQSRAALGQRGCKLSSNHKALCKHPQPFPLHPNGEVFLAGPRLIKGLMVTGRQGSMSMKLLRRARLCQRRNTHTHTHSQKTQRPECRLPPRRRRAILTSSRLYSSHCSGVSAGD